MKSQRTVGLTAALASYVIWGVLPIYWKQLKAVNAVEVLSHRIIWSFVFVVLLIFSMRQWATVREVIRNRKKLLLIFAAAILITINWGLFIWSIQVNRILDSSLGYFINPLVAVLLGVFIFREKLDRWQQVAIGLATAGVLVLIIEFGQFPWLSMSLALSFGFYGAIKKFVQIPSIIGLALETAFILPLALGWVMFRQITQVGALGRVSLVETVLLLGAGVITAVPLLLFAEGASRIPLSMMGITQYISPTMMFILGLFVYHEPFKLVNGISFGLIWLALIVYTISQTKWVVKTASKPVTTD
ncbi:MAG: EamA family transporter RarD [Eubacteriales bacterium]|nr:EamA family transporter RarD [Eubacteriales bacterium]